jgi:hypothetical protein
MGTMVAKTIIDAKGDLIAGTAADTASRLAVGTNGQVLVADSTAATGLAWSTASASSPLTTKGDLYGFSTVNARIPVGTNGQILTADSTAATGVAWAAASSGGFTYATYTPTFTGFTKGNATIIARYAQSGKGVNVFVDVTLGSTSSVTGGITVSLPVTAASDALGSRGVCGIVDTGVYTRQGVAFVETTTTALLKVIATSAAFGIEDDISATSPMTWVSTDKFNFTLTYEAA